MIQKWIRKIVLGGKTTAELEEELRIIEELHEEHIQRRKLK